jgi:tetratricopeptide (TPR) repeat protein
MFRGDLDESERWHRRLIEEAEAANDRWATAGAHGNLALLAHERGDLDDALEHARAGHTETRAIEDGWGVAIAAGNLASVMIQRGEDDAGTALLLEEALYQSGRFGMESIQVEAGVLYAQVLTRLGRYDAAFDAIERARALLDAGALSDVVASSHGAAPAASFRRAIDDCLSELEAAPRGM